MTRRRRPELTQPKNPRQLTINQHVHAKACIERFTDASGRVGVVRPGAKAFFLARPENPVFCAQRVWDQHLEHGGLVRGVERSFQVEVASVLRGRPVGDHEAVSAYASIWAIRSRLADQPPEDFVLDAQPSAAGHLTKDQEEILEAKHGAFTRGGALPGRFVAYPEALRAHDVNMLSLKSVRWGVFRAQHGGLLCPGSPGRELYLPVAPTVALIAGYRDREIARADVEELNQSLLGNGERLVFGRPADIRRAMSQRAGGAPG